MWKRITACFSCRRRGYERKSDEEKTQSEESEKYGKENKLGKDEQRDDDSLDVNRDDNYSGQVLNGQQECVSKQHQVVESEDEIGKVGETTQVKSEADDGRNKSEKASNDGQEISKEWKVSQVRVTDETVKPADVCNEIVQNEATSLREEGKEVAFNVNAQKTNTTDSLSDSEIIESCIDYSRDRPLAKEAKNVEVDQPENVTKVSDSVLSEAVNDILGALDDVLSREKTTKSEIRTVDVSALISDKPHAENNVEETSTPNSIPEIVVTEAGIEAHKDNRLKKLLKIEDRPAPEKNKPGDSQAELSDDYKLKNYINDLPLEQDSELGKPPNDTHVKHILEKEVKQTANKTIVEQLPEQIVKQQQEIIKDTQVKLVIEQDVKQTSNESIVEQLPEQAVEQKSMAEVVSEQNKSDNDTLVGQLTDHLAEKPCTNFLEEQVPEQQIAHGSDSSFVEQVSKLDVGETSIISEHTQHPEKTSKRRSLIMVEKFSEKLSSTVIDAVLNKPESKPGPTSSEEDFSNFSDILADSIVKTVLDYTKPNQDQAVLRDENSNHSISDECMETEADDTIQEVNLAELIEDDTSSIEEADDDSPRQSLDVYAKQLAEQIITKVLKEQSEINEQYTDQEHSMAEIYISDLTETVISHAIDRVKGCQSKSSTDNVDEDSKTLDGLVSELVQNVLKSAISRMADQIDEEESQGTQQGYQQNGHTDNQDHVNDSGIGAGIANGKLQSKWLSEDDLDELHDDDWSDEDVKLEDTSGLNNDKKLSDNQTTMNANSLTGNEERIDVNDSLNFLRPHNSASNKEQTSVWRRSLIEDLDQELEFEEEDSSPCGSLTKSDHFDDLQSDSSEDEQEECITPTAKVPPAPFKTSQTTSSRSRLRSVDSTPVLVFDNGSGFLKVGYSCDSTPREIIPSVVGLPLRYSQDISGMEYSSRPGLVFGDIAVGKAGVLHNDYPLKADVIEKWSDIEGLWNYVLSSLMSVPEHPEFPILLTQPALNSKKNTEKLAEIMFEKFHIPSLFIASQPALALFSMGYTSGLSFCSGFNKTQAGVVYEGHVLPHTVQQLDIAGYQLTESLKKLLMSGQGFGFRSSSQWKIVNDIKKKMGFVSTDFQADVKRYKTEAHLHEPYELPDGQVIEVGAERFGCAEILFRPEELGLTQLPVHMLITEAIQSCEAELQEMCYKAIGVSGGTTLMKGFPQRLENELCKSDWKCKNLIIPEHRDLSTWLGGGIVASLPTFREMVVGVDEYADVGAKIVHSKCF